MTTETDTVLIPGVTVTVNLDREGDPLVMILTRGNGEGTAEINVSARGVDESALCALLRVVATTIEQAGDERAVYAHLRDQHRHEVLSDVDLIEFHDRLYPDCEWSTS